MSDIPELKKRATLLLTGCGVYMAEAEDRPDGVKDMANMQETLGLAVQLLVDISRELQKEFDESNEL